MHLEGTPSVMDFDPFQQQVAGTVTGPVAGSQFQYATTHHVGEPVRLADGRIFRFTLAGATNLVAGTLQLPIAEITNHYEINPSAAITNFTTVNSVSVTLGATATLDGEYNEGFLTFSSGNNVGLSYQISYNPVIALSTAGVFTLYDFLQNSVATSDTVDISHNQWYKVIQSPAAAGSQTSRAAGVPMIAITAAYGGWLITKGIAPCIADGTVAVGTELVASSGTAGAVTGRSTTWSTAVAQIKVGEAGLKSAIVTNSKPILLKVD